MNFNEHKRTIIIGAVLLLVIIIGLFIFIKKSNEEEKKKDKEQNYTLLFQYVNKETRDLEQDMQFVYKESKLNKVILTMYFIEDDITKLIAEEYKSGNDFKNVTYTKNTVSLEYSNSMMKEYSGLSKEELIQLLEGQGYSYKK